MTSTMHPNHDDAAGRLAQNLEAAAAGGPLTLQLRERFVLPFEDALKSIAEAKRRLGK